jgi:hypothetical protein
MARRRCLKRSKSDEGWVRSPHRSAGASGCVDRAPLYKLAAAFLILTPLLLLYTCSSSGAHLADRSIPTWRSHDVGLRLPCNETPPQAHVDPRTNATSDVARTSTAMPTPTLDFRTASRHSAVGVSVTRTPANASPRWAEQSRIYTAEVVYQRCGYAAPIGRHCRVVLADLKHQPGIGVRPGVMHHWVRRSIVPRCYAVWGVGLGIYVGR